MTSIVIPEGVTSIENEAFSECSSLQMIYAENPSAPGDGDDAFTTGTRESCLLYVPKGSKQSYVNTWDWQENNVIEMSIIGNLVETLIPGVAYALYNPNYTAYAIINPEYSSEDLWVAEATQPTGGNSVDYSSYSEPLDKKSPYACWQFIENPNVEALAEIPNITELGDIVSDGEFAPAFVYTLTGVNLGIVDPKQLPAGVYIREGRKFIVK